MNTLKLAVYVAAAACSAANAVEVQCHVNDVTEARTCYAPSQVIEKDGIRSAPLIMGGPNEMRPTAFTLAVNCATGVAHLKDRQGVSFAGGGPTEGTDALRSLKRWICAEQLRKPKTARK